MWGVVRDENDVPAIVRMRIDPALSDCVTYKPGFTGTEGIFLSVQGGLGFSASPAPLTIGTATAANPTVGGSVTASGSWTVPQSGPGGKLTFNLQGGPSTTHGVGWGLTPQVSYSKIP